MVRKEPESWQAKILSRGNGGKVRDECEYSKTEGHGRVTIPQPGPKTDRTSGRRRAEFTRIENEATNR